MSQFSPGRHKQQQLLQHSITDRGFSHFESVLNALFIWLKYDMSLHFHSHNFSYTVIYLYGNFRVNMYHHFNNYSCQYVDDCIYMFFLNAVLSSV